MQVDALAIDEDDIRLPVMLDDGMPAATDDRHQILMPDRVASHQGDTHRRPLPRWFADGAHRDGRAVIVALSVSRVPARSKLSSSCWPMLSGPKDWAIRLGRPTTVPPMATKMSPAITPAAAAGPPSATRKTIRDRKSTRLNSSHSS